MSNPCATKDCATVADLRWWNRLKWFAIIGLLALLLLMLLRGCGAIVAPTIGLASTDTTTGEAVFEGTGAPGSVIQVELNNQTIGSTQADANGNWSLTHFVTDSGDYEAVARSLNSNGSEAAHSNTATFALGGLGAGAAAFSAATPQISNFAAAANGRLSGLLNWQGTGLPGKRIRIISGNRLLATTDVQADGNWSLNQPITADAGDLSLFARMVDDNNRVLGESNQFSLNFPADVAVEDGGSGEVAATDLAVPTLGLAAVGAGYLLEGSAEPGSELDVFVDGAKVGTVTVGADGNWQFPYDFTPGDHDLSASYVVGTVGATDSETVSVNVPDLETPTIELVTNENGAGAILQGTAAPNTEIEIVVDGEVVGTTTTDADGNWQYLPTVAAGYHGVMVRYLDGGAASQTVGLYAPQDAALGLWPALFVNVADRNQAPVLEGTGLPEGFMDIYVNGDYDRSVSSNDVGKWRYSRHLPVGDHWVHATHQPQDGIDMSSFPLVHLWRSDVGAVRVLLRDATDADGADAGADSGAPFAVDLIIDSSWSMTLDLTGDNRLTADNADSRVAIAREALLDLVNNVLPEGTPLAIRAFGNVEGDLACRTDLMLEYQPMNSGTAASVINGIAPKFNANTALAASLSKVSEDVAAATLPVKVVLLTDGKETCGGDPAAEIQALIDSGVDVHVDIVGFAIADEALQADFENWATIGGGNYYNARNADELASSLAESLVVRYRVLDADGNEVAVGRIGGAPVYLPAGTYTVEVQNDAGTVIENVTVENGIGTRVVAR